MARTASLCVVLCVLLAAGCAPALKEVMIGPPPVADGAIVAHTAVVEATAAYEAGRSAALALKKHMGADVPQAVLLSENFEEQADKRRVLQGVCSVFPADAVFGMATYGSFAQDGCKENDSVALVGIGGPGVSVSAALQRDFGVGKLNMADAEETIKTRLLAAGGQLAEKLPRTPQDRLLVLLADAHSPKNAFLVQGVQKVVGNAFPIVGGCANKNAGQTFVYYRGRMFPDSGVALMLAGDFQVGLSGRKAKDNAKVIATAKEGAAEALAAVKAKPFAVLAFNCAGRKGKLENVADELAAMQQALGKTVPLFGCYCAGEIGPVDQSERKPGVLSGGSGWHVMFAILARGK